MSLPPTPADGATVAEVDTGPSPEALTALEQLLVEAYGISGGRAALDAVTDIAIGLTAVRDYGSEDWKLPRVIHALRQELVDRGPPVIRKCCEAFYVAMPGNEALRLWIAQHQPTSVAMVSPEAFEAAREAYVESHKAGRQQQLAIGGFAALGDARGEVFVDREIARFREKLTAAIQQLQRLKGYKQLHDHLHDIQTQPLASFARLMLRQSLDVIDQAEIKAQAGWLKVHVPKARNILQGFEETLRAPEERWLARLEASTAELDKLDPNDRNALRRLSLEIGAVLRAQLPKLNDLLTEAARKIPFEDLSDFLREAASRAPAGSPLTAKVEEAAAALDAIAARLNEKISIHDAWQDVDIALWAMEPVVRTIQDSDSRLEIGSIWQTARDSVDMLDDLDPAGVATIHQASEGFTEALRQLDQQPLMLALAFQNYASMVRQQFHMVDRQLLDQCEMIAELEPKLSSLIEGDG